MITLEQYFSGGKGRFGEKLLHADATGERQERAELLLDRVNAMLAEAASAGAYADEIDDDTGSQISGVQGGSGDGGFRLQNSGTGAGRSKHKEGAAVDIFDPSGKLDAWLTDAILKRYGLFREHPSATNGWCHVQTIPPGAWKADSELRTYLP